MTVAVPPTGSKPVPVMVKAVLEHTMGVVGAKAVSVGGAKLRPC